MRTNSELELKHDSTEAILQKPPIFSRKQVIFSRFRRKILKHVWLARVGLVAGILAILTIAFIFLIKTAGASRVGNYIGLAYNFIAAPKDKISSFGGRTNFLILGKSGGAYTAPDLTDTIIVASISLDKSSIVTISIPRDIWIPAIRAKVNSAYYWGKQKEESSQTKGAPTADGGITMAKSTVEQIVGIPIHYGLVIDFSGFTKIIDVLGGIEINVERGFVDNKYPIQGKENDECGGDIEYKCRYKTVEFKAGTQAMNGETALTFVRSRNAQGDEGTDIAREARQEKVISALKGQILSVQTLTSPMKLLKLYNAVREFVETDASGAVGAIIARRVLVSKNNIVSEVIPDEYLLNPPKSTKYDNLYVFIPKDGSWLETQNWIKSLLN